MTQGSPAPTTTTAATAPPPTPRVAGSLYDAYLSELFNNASKKDDGEGDGLNVTKLDEDDALLPACNYFGQYPPPRSSTSSSRTTNSTTTNIANSTAALSRNVCIITTAAMPWRTGTAVNPLLRALYLIRYRREQRERERREREQQTDVDANTNAADDNDNATKTNRSNNNNNNDNEGGGKVALVIPWLESKEERIQLYGEQNSFDDSNDDDDDYGNKNEENDNSPQQSNNNDNNNNNSNKSSKSSSTKSTSNLTPSTTKSIGMTKQEAWIRHYSSTACQMPIESKQLVIIFYPAFYQANFGSIFPKVDLCNYIPTELVDVVILEEPEHLNWFCMPYHYYNNNNTNNDKDDERNDEKKNDENDDDDGEGGVGEDNDNAA
jgi:hypothetical protein